MNKNKSSKVLSKSIYDSLSKQLREQREEKVEIMDEKEIAGWFMGTQGENLAELSQIINNVIDKIIGGRAAIFPDDPGYITEEIKKSRGYKEGIKSVTEQSEKLLEILNKYSLPMQSARYQGHMNWDITLPSLVGYFAAMLQNQNNVTPQASPATTIMELLAANDIAQMAGFKTKRLDDLTPAGDEINAWAHISCDGSVANIESLWAARELKFLPLGIKYALNKGEYLEAIADSLILPGGVPVKEATAWELLNLKQDDILLLPEQITRLDPAKDLSTVWSELTSNYSLNARGIQFFYSQYLTKEDIKAPTLIVPSTKHYSWPKAASLLGMGNGKKGLAEAELVAIDKIKDHGLINIYVDAAGKVKTELLEDVLKVCRENKKPVVMVVGVFGTTEEGAVDPLEEIIAIRERFRMEKKLPFEYSIHADAAWGGYFLTCCRNEFPMEGYPEKPEELRGGSGELFDNKDSWFRESVYKNMVNTSRCDSATIDPHKMGYIPYPAGSLIYRNDRIVNLLTFSAPYISSEKADPGNINTRNIGQCGIEGSKAGAAAAAVYLSHRVIRPDKRGYGKIINQSMLNSKIFYLYLNSLKEVFPDDKFEIVMFNEFPREYDTDSNRECIKNNLWGNKLNITSLPVDLQSILKNIAGDQNIIDYIFIDPADRSVTRTIALNNAIFTQLYLSPGEEVTKDEIFVSMTTFYRNEYGDTFMDTLGERLKPDGEPYGDRIPCIRSVVMDPWAIYTHKDAEERMHNFFTDIFIPKLRETVNYLCTRTTEELNEWKKISLG